MGAAHEQRPRDLVDVVQGITEFRHRFHITGLAVVIDLKIQEICILQIFWLTYYVCTLIDDRNRDCSLALYNKANLLSVNRNICIYIFILYNINISRNS